MKHVFFSLLLMVVSAQIAVAQNTILMGKIVNEDHEPIAGATLRLSKAGKAVEATSDNDGLFYSRLLASDNYHLDVVVDGKYMRTKKLFLPPAEKKKVFHYLRVVGDKVIITVREDDPFLKHKLSKIEADTNNRFDHGRIYFFRLDSSGKGHVLDDAPVRVRKRD